MHLPELPAGFDAAREFPSLKNWNFFNHSGVSPMGSRAAGAMRRYADESERDSYLTGKWYKQAETTRAAAAKLINADPAEIAFVKNTSEGLAFVSNGMSWKDGDEIVSTAVEYPANVYPWMDAAKQSGGRVKHIMVKERDGRIYLDDLFAAVTAKTRMIALSHVQYASGFRSDIAAVGRFCKERGILFCVDAIQSCGTMPVDVRTMHIDFLSAGGHKWMLGPEGAGIFFCRRELITSLHPEVGAMNVINATDYANYDFTLREDAKRFECGGYNLAGVLALGAALQLLLEVGVDRIWSRIYSLTSMLVDGVRSKGYEVFSPRQKEDECSGIVSFYAPGASPARHDEILTELQKQRIVLVQREKRLRAAPHFYQGEQQIQALIDALPAH